MNEKFATGQKIGKPMKANRADDLGFGSTVLKTKMGSVLETLPVGKTF